MSLHDPSPKLTYEDYILFPDDGKRHENHRRRPLRGRRPLRATPETRRPFHPPCRGIHRGAPTRPFLVAPTDIVLSPHHVLQPDLLFISNERESILREKNVQGAPDLVIEILSGATRRLDTVVKRQAYERFGVREYWLVDPHRQSIEVWTLTAEGYLRGVVVKAEEGDVLTSTLLPALRIALAEILKN